MARPLSCRRWQPLRPERHPNTIDRDRPRKGGTMNLRQLGFLILLTATSFTLATVSPASAATPPYDYSHARVVRLSLVEGDVQVSRPRAQDSDDQGNGETWEQALLNLPIRQGYTLATGNGRAEIEFESGATARLAENSVLQLTELALSNGGRITPMTLTQRSEEHTSELQSPCNLGCRLLL